MAMSPGKEEGLPSLTAITFKRGLVAGRLYLALATLITLILTAVLLHNAKPGVFANTFPLELPLFATLGSMGGIMLFVSDRSKGVLEYLIAYGVRPRSLFLNVLLTAAALSSLVLFCALAVGLGGYLLVGNTLTTDLENSILGYTVPMTYASALFATMTGMLWSVLSTPRAGLNSPVGVSPLLGIAPPMLVLILADAVDKSAYYDITVGASIGFLLVVAGLLVLSTRLMGRERFLSAM